ncbi:MAG: DinB family protein [Nocardioides sp.]
MTTVDWNAELAAQLTWHWEHLLRPRLAGLSDEEYLWEPVPGCWSLRRRGIPTSWRTAGAGEFVMEYDVPDPEPAPVTTIAWRLAHVIVGCLAARTASHFGGAPAGYDSWSYAGTADQAVAQLDEQYAAWSAGVAALGDEGLARPCGDAEGPFAAYPLAALVLHINREMIHHGAEICLLRDLYLRHQESA